MGYPFDYNKKQYWVELQAYEQPITNTSAIGDLKPQAKQTSYKSDTGQVISNCYIFLEGLDSENVTSRVNSIIRGRSLAHNLDIVNLANQDFIASYLFKYVIQNNICSFTMIVDCLDYLFQTSRHLASKTGHTVNVGPHGRGSTNRPSQSMISRCSYKFCTHTHCCQYNYPERKRSSGKGCYSDHYVHHKVALDVHSLKCYIEEIFFDPENDNIVIRNNQEIIKCVNTITFVVKHMYDELWNVYISCQKKKSYEELHKNITTP